MGLSNELLATFQNDLASVKLVPGASGRFEVSVDGDLVFSKVELGRFPEEGEVREKIRARLRAAA